MCSLSVSAVPEPESVVIPRRRPCARIPSQKAPSQKTLPSNCCTARQGRCFTLHQGMVIRCEAANRARRGPDARETTTMHVSTIAPTRTPTRPKTHRVRHVTCAISSTCKLVDASLGGRVGTPEPVTHLPESRIMEQWWSSAALRPGTPGPPGPRTSGDPNQLDAAGARKVSVARQNNWEGSLDRVVTRSGNPILPDSRERRRQGAQSRPLHRDHPDPQPPGIRTPGIRTPGTPPQRMN
jgi:hypothetical protein